MRAEKAKQSYIEMKKKYEEVLKKFEDRGSELDELKKKICWKAV